MSGPARAADGPPALARVITSIRWDTKGTHYRPREVLDRPAPAVTVSGGATTHFMVTERSMPLSDLPDAPASANAADKPPYRVPSMDEVRAIPWNGLCVVSTFAGGGGSSLGYRMAGFRVLWASEFVDAARETYVANKAPYTVVDGRDIRTVAPADVLEATGLQVGELDILDGSPPCASFSTAGRRHVHWGKVKKYSDREQRTDDLFFEFVRFVDGLRPRVFVAENVSGLVKGVAKGYFKAILAALKAPGYRVEARLLDAQWLGVPQTRRRLIFIGVRDDLGLEPVHPKPLPYRYSVREAIPWINRLAVSKDAFVDAERNVSPTILASTGRRTSSTLGGEHLSYVEVDADGDGTDISRYAIGAEWDRIRPGSNSDRYFNLSKPALGAPCPTVTAAGGTLSAAAVIHPTERRKFTIAELKRVCAFPDDYVLTGTYAQQWERLGRAVPPLMMRAIAATVRDAILTRAR